MNNKMIRTLRAAVAAAATVATISLAPLPLTSAADFSLTEEILSLSLTAAKLSALAYADDETKFQWAAVDVVDGVNLTTYDHPDYDDIMFYTEEPDQAIVARKGSRCYIGFRGTKVDRSDWAQNLDWTSRDVYRDNDESTGEYCEVRAGFADFLDTTAVSAGTAKAKECIAACPDPGDCLVITGHSQGGATALIASILFHSADPTLVTFGQPPTIDDGCEDLVPDRYYRYVNSKAEIGETDDMGFDLVPFAPTVISRSVHYGHYIMLGEDDKAVAYLGTNQDYDFSGPSLTDEEIDAHTMSDEPYSYQSRIESLLASGSFPVGVEGFSDGVICEEDYETLCASGTCLCNLCAPPADACDADDGCPSEKPVCIRGVCAVAEGKAAENCPCRYDRECASDECIQFSLNWVCDAVDDKGRGNPGDSGDPDLNDKSGGPIGPLLRAGLGTFRPLLVACLLFAVV